MTGLKEHGKGKVTTSAGYCEPNILFSCKQLYREASEVFGSSLEIDCFVEVSSTQFFAGNLVYHLRLDVRALHLAFWAVA